MLLQRGVSTDHCDEDGIDVHAVCWYSRDYRKEGASATDTFKVVNEYVALDPMRTWFFGINALHMAAANGDARDIDNLIAYGHDANVKDEEGATAIYAAVQNGNAPTYFALLAHGAELNFSPLSVEVMLHEALVYYARGPDPLFLLSSEPGDFQSIIRHILQHGQPNLDARIRGDFTDEEYPPTIRGRKVTPTQLAKALGPATEAWFLVLLQESGKSHYMTASNKLRLEFLRHAGYASQGCVLGDDADLFDDNDSYQNEDHTDKDDGDDHDSRRDEGDNTSKQHEWSDVEEEEQFWDAEQGL